MSNLYLIIFYVTNKGQNINLQACTNMAISLTRLYYKLTNIYVYNIFNLEYTHNVQF